MLWESSKLASGILHCQKLLLALVEDELLVPEEKQVDPDQSGGRVAHRPQAQGLTQSHSELARAEARPEPSSLCPISVVFS